MPNLVEKAITLGEHIRREVISLLEPKNVEKFCLNTLGDLWMRLFCVYDDANELIVYIYIAMRAQVLDQRLRLNCHFNSITIIS